MSAAGTVCHDLLRLDCAREAERICSRIREMVFGELKRKGAVIGVSGGIDSAVVAFLCARALDPKRILLLLLPEAESSSDSTTLGKMVADVIQARSIVEDLTPLLKAAGCYQRRDDAVRCVIPEFGPGYKCKIALPNMSQGEHYALFRVVVQSPDGLTQSARLNAAASLGVVAATNFKQRARKMMEYYYADLLPCVSLMRQRGSSPWRVSTLLPGPSVLAFSRLIVRRVSYVRLASSSNCRTSRFRSSWPCSTSRVGS